MTIAREGSQTIGIQGATGVQAISHTFAASVTVGNAIMAFAKAGDDDDTISFADDQSNTWATDVHINDAVAFETAAIGSAKNVTTGGTLQVTASINGGTNRRMFLATMEYTFAGGAVLDQTSSGSTGGSGTANALSGSVATTVADELLFGGHGDGFNGTPTTYNNSFLLLGESSTGRASGGDRIVSSTGTYEVDITLSNSVVWACCIATYSEAGGAGANYDRAITDGISVGDASINIASLLSSITDGSLFGDTPINIATLGVLLADGIKLGDSSDRTALLESLITDGVEISDTIINISDLVSIISDGTNLGDSVNNIGVLVAALTDGALLGDSSTNIVSLQVTISDGIKVGDSNTRIVTLESNISEGVKIGDITSALTELVVSMSDGVVYGDTVFNIVDLLIALSDGVVLSDTIATDLGVFAKALADGFKMGDTSSSLVTLEVSISDGVKIGDNNIVSIVFEGQLIDIVILGDMVSSIADLLSGVTDGISMSDVIALLAQGIASKSITVTFTDKTGSVTFTDKTGSVTFS